MTGGPWFSALEIAHRTRGRVRLRYRCRAGAPTAPKAIERALENLPGVTRARVNQAARSVVVNFADAETGVEQLVGRVAGLPVPAVSDRVAAAAANDTRPLMASLATLLGTRYLPPSAQLPITMSAATPVFKHAFEDYRENGVSSHVLEALAVSISLARRDYTAANTTTFMLALGEYLEDSIARRSDDLLKHLLRPASDEVWVVRQGQEVSIAAEDVVVGDTVIVGSGTVVPVDGTVLGGEATVNQAAMTGESVAVNKARGDAVLSGTVVEEGRLSVLCRAGRSQPLPPRASPTMSSSP